MELATIDELMEGQEPGSIKVTAESWEPGKYFIPYYKDQNNCWWGPIEDGDSDWYRSRSKVWSIYTPPKKKVKMWQWLLKQEAGYFISWHAESMDGGGFQAIKRLDHTEIEVEID